MNIAYVCYEDKGKYKSDVPDEDSQLLAYLQQQGLRIRREIWTDEAVSWEQYQLVLLKAPWDYYDRIADFHAWLQRLEGLQVPLLNPSAIVKWNSDKHYLQDIAAAGLPVIPTQFLEKGERPALEPYFAHFNTGKIIVKPAVSGGSKNTFALTPPEAAAMEPTIHALLQEEAFLVQPFIPAIQEEGEWSFLFFGGHFSHALVKKAKAGDFRVQHYLGGSIHPVQAPPELKAAAEKYVQAFAQGCLYARVDGLVTADGFQLMELELIEPFLFLLADEGSYERYYRALCALAPQAALPAGI